MNFSIRLATRYFRTGGTQTITMVLLVAVGVLTYIFVSAAVNGIQGNTISSFLGSSSNVTLEPVDKEIAVFPDQRGIKPLVLERANVPEQKKISGWRDILPVVENTPGVTVVSPLVSSGCVLIRGDISRSATIRGMDPVRGKGIVDLNKYIVDGKGDLRNSEIIIGTVLARKSGVKVGERIRVQGGSGVQDMFLVSGILKGNNFQMNESMVYMTLADAQRISNVPGDITAIETKISDIFAAELIALRMSDATKLKATAWMTESGELLGVLNTSGIIFGLVRVFALAAVSFGIAAVLSVAVNQRSKEIGILKSMGATTTTMIFVFLILGLIVGFVGGVFGSAGSYLLIQFLGNLKPPAGASGGPVTLTFDFRPEYVTQGISIAVLVSVAGAILPSRKAANLDPVEAIRNG